MRYARKIGFAVIAILLFYSIQFSTVATTSQTRVILFSWDGTQKNHLNEMLSNEELHNLSRIRSQGIMREIMILDHANSETGPGHAEMLTGYGEEKTGVIKNDDALPDGITIFERLESYDSNIVTGAIFGKNRPHFPTRLLNNASPDIDWYITLSDWSGWNGYSPNHSYAGSIALKANEFINFNRDRSFFLFIHFTDPDTQGQEHGENSRYYSDAIKEADTGLGIIIGELEKLGIYEQTIIMVTTDHGFNEDAKTHFSAPDTLELWMASNRKNAISRGTLVEQNSITPTILELFGTDIKHYNFDGESLSSGELLPSSTKSAPEFEFLAALTGISISICLRKRRF